VSARIIRLPFFLFFFRAPAFLAEDVLALFDLVFFAFVFLALVLLAFVLFAIGHAPCWFTVV
jgi:hypothetical protein